MDHRIKAYMAIAAKYNLPLLLDVPTWRASEAWFEKLNTSIDDRNTVHARALQFVQDAVAAERQRTGHLPDVFVQGIIGPMDDAYANSNTTVAAAQEYHSKSIRAFKAAGASRLSGMTFPSSIEAAGVAKSAAEEEMPITISFVMKTSGRLPSGESLKDAVEFVDKACDRKPVDYMVNCIHPKFIKPVLEEAVRNNETWVHRIAGVRGNASTKSHEELDGCANLDQGNIREWTADLLELHRIVPTITRLGGCCGTDEVHVDKIGAMIGGQV